MMPKFLFTSLVNIFVRICLILYFPIFNNRYPTMDSPLTTIASALRTDAEFSEVSINLLD